jgi:endonuclease/exonuclease/phosphatase family metal-dependent hydrolase
MDPFRILCYNVCNFPWHRTPIQEMVAWMTANADIVALQEAWCRHSTWAAAFAAAGWTFQRPPREHHICGIFGSGLAIAWRTDSWTPVGDARFYPYLAAVGLDQLATKGWLRVDLQQRRTGATFRLINTHMQADYEIGDELWQHIVDPIRMAQARELARVEQRTPGPPTLVVGDFNAQECWIPNARFLNPCTVPTFPAEGKFLDHVATWHPGWCLLEHEVATGRTWSDHLAIRWTLDWGVRTVLAPSQRSSQEPSAPASRSEASPEPRAKSSRPVPEGRRIPPPHGPVPAVTAAQIAHRSLEARSL